MKNLYLLFFAAILFGCNQQDPVKVVDSRPKEQLALIKQLANADSVQNAQVNDITKQEARDSGRVKISKFVLANLKGRADKWQATVLSIEGGPGASIELMFPKGLEFDEQYPDQNAIILKNEFLEDNILNKVKLLAKGDKVLVTGHFDVDTTVEPKIIMNSYTMRDENLFSNPTFVFTIDDIKKIQTQQ